MSMEMWDDLAKKNYANIKKGRPVRGLGYVIQNKWTDKDTGEERKMYKVRITKMMAAEDFDKVSELFEDIDDSRNHMGPVSDFSDTGFSSTFPTNDDQTSAYEDPLSDGTVMIPDSQMQSGGGYTYRKLSAPPAASTWSVSSTTSTELTTTATTAVVSRTRGDTRSHTCTRRWRGRQESVGQLTKRVSRNGETDAKGYHTHVARTQIPRVEVNY